MSIEVSRRTESISAIALASALVLSSVGAAAQPTRDVRIDYSRFRVSLVTNFDSDVSPPRTHYRTQIYYALYGAGARSGDAVRARLLQGERVVAEERCPVRRSRVSRGLAAETCNINQEVTDADDLRLQLTYVDQTSDAETVLHDAPLTINRTWEYQEGTGNPHAVRYQASADDIMGLGVVTQLHVMPDSATNDGPGGLRFTYWASRFEGQNASGEHTLRCQDRAGAWQAFDLSGSAQNTIDAPNRVRSESGVVHQSFVWEQWSFTSNNVPFTLERSRFAPRTPWPSGRYVCQIRRDRNVVREFRFNVNGRGQIVDHPVQAGPAGVTVGPDGVVVDMFFPTATEGMDQLAPDAIRRSFAYGRPWPNPEAMREMFDALPAPQRPAFATPPRGATVPRGSGAPGQQPAASDGGRRGGGRRR